MLKTPQTTKLEKEEYPKQGKQSGLTGYCQDLYEEYRTSEYRQRKLDEINDGRKRYKGDRPEKTFPWPGASNKTLLLEAIAIDNIEPRLAAQLIAEDDFINVQPTGPEDREQATETQFYLNWAFQNNIEISKKIKPIVHNLLMDGTIFVIPIWEEKFFTNKIRKNNPIVLLPDGQTAIPLPDEVPEDQLAARGLEVIGYEDTFIEVDDSKFTINLEQISISDSFWPDTGGDWEEQPFLRLIYPTLPELEEMSKKNGGPYKNISEDLVLHNLDGSDEQDQDQEEKGVHHSMYTSEIKLLECHVKWRNEWRIVTYAIDSNWTEVRNQKLSDVYWHGRKPIRCFKLFPETNETLGVGIPKKIEHYAKGIDQLYNQMIDAGTIEIIPWGFYEEAIGGARLDLKIEPGKWNPIAKGSKPYPMGGGVRSQGFIPFIELLLAFFERLLSLMDSTLPGNTSARGGAGTETYSGMALLVQEANIKHQYTGESLRDEFERLIEDCLQIYAQNIPYGFTARVFENGEQTFKEFDAASIQGRFDIKIEVSDNNANKRLNRQEQVEKYNTLVQNPYTDQIKLIKDYLKSYDVRTPDEYINPQFLMLSQALEQAPELTQMIQQYMQQKQEQMRQQELQQQAKSNIERQAIQRKEEQTTNLEDQKLVDQVKESAKRKLITPTVEAGVVQSIFGGQ